jgi:hypothetical protein
MAGGLFGKPFVFNEKCIVFSIICMTLFLYKPNFNNQYYLYFSLFLIFVISYVSMAWYDYFFNCDIVPLKKGSIGGITGSFKPPSHIKDKQEGDQPSDFKAKNIIIYLSHILFIVPILGYIAIYKKKINPIIYPLLGVLSVFTAGYHGVSLMAGTHY